jgi:hypothetical protein
MAALGERWYRQEYLCSFEDVIDTVFAEEDIQRAIVGSFEPLFGGSPDRRNGRVSANS